MKAQAWPKNTMSEYIKTEMKPRLTNHPIQPKDPAKSAFVSNHYLTLTPDIIIRMTPCRGSELLIPRE
jgi:hypothetical protein